MKKRGVSQVLVTALVILIVIAAIGVVYSVIKMILYLSVEKTEDTFICLTDVDLSLINSCYSGNQIKFIIQNKNNFDYETDFFILKLNKQGNSLEIPTNWHSTLHGLEQKEFVADVDNPQIADSFIFIPKIKEEKGYCYGQAITFKPEACSEA